MLRLLRAVASWFSFRHQAIQTVFESIPVTHLVCPNSEPLSLLLSRSYKLLKVLPHAVCLKRKVIKCIRQECGLSEDLSANTQKANIESSTLAINRVEVIESRSVVQMALVIDTGRVAANPYLLTSEHEVVDPNSDLRRKAKEWRTRCVVSHYLFMSS